VQGSFIKMFSPTYTIPKDSTAYEDNKITLANVTVSIAGARTTTALQGVTIRDVKAWIEQLEKGHKQKAAHVTICVYIDSVRSRREAVDCRKAFERYLSGKTEDLQG